MPKTALAALILSAALALPAAADCRFTLHFAHGSAEIKLADNLLLADLARAYPAARFALSAHADDDGSAAGNARVASARAGAVARRLMQAGLAPDQVVALSADWDATPATTASSALNRRVELFVAGCDPKAHPEARLPWSPGVALDAGAQVFLTSPLLPSP